MGQLGRPIRRPDWLEKAQELRREGKTYGGIASLLGVTTAQVEWQLCPERKEKANRKVTLTCPDCGRQFERRPNRKGTGKCNSCAQRMRPLRVVECIGCGETFETKEQDKKYCSRRCYLNNHPGSTEKQIAAVTAVGQKRKGEANPNFRHGRRAGEHERRLAREFNLEKKGERVCRACGSTRAMQAHHAVPRSLSQAGKYDLRNCLPLCAVCHTSWHRRSLTIYRDIFTELEWEFIATLINPGWLDERYPDRGRAHREEGMERVPA
jgi:hypothetical protein